MPNENGHYFFCMWDIYKRAFASCSSVVNSHFLAKRMTWEHDRCKKHYCLLLELETMQNSRFLLLLKYRRGFLKKMVSFFTTLLK